MVEKVFVGISQVLYISNALSFIVNDPYFKIMLDSNASFGPGLRPPSYMRLDVFFFYKKRLKQSIQSV